MNDYTVVHIGIPCYIILSSQVVSLPLQSVILMEVANVCAAMDTLIDQDVVTCKYFGVVVFFKSNLDGDRELLPNRGSNP